jgi:hypothetical protein
MFENKMLRRRTSEEPEETCIKRSYMVKKKAN